MILEGALLRRRRQQGEEINQNDSPKNLPTNIKKSIFLLFFYRCKRQYQKALSNDLPDTQKAPKRHHGGTKMNPRSGPGAPRSVPRGAQTAPGAAPEPLQSSPGSLREPGRRPEASRESFWSYFGSIFDPPGHHFQRCSLIFL